MQDILTTTADGVLRITLHRPQQGNAITASMAQQLQQRLQELAEKAAHVAAVRVVLLCGAGPDFCTGLDEADEDNMALHAELLRQLRALPQPVLAMVHGACHGAAIGIVEACDIVFAANSAQFVVRSGQAVDGVQAEVSGLVTRSFPAAELEHETLALAAELAAKDALTLQFTKDTLRQVGNIGWDAVLDFNAAKFAALQALQAGKPSARAAAVESFLAGKSKPGLGG
jgi:enoyl-CoA hydratase/carnithine racemase